MATKLKTVTVSGLDAAQPDRTVPQPRLIVIEPWWSHPRWCAEGDNCYGGDVIDFGSGSTVTTSRHHHGVLLATSVYDIDGTQVDVRIEIEAVEDPNEGFIDGPFVNIDMPHGMLTDADSAERIANAMLAAVAAARQPLTADVVTSAVTV